MILWGKLEGAGGWRGCVSVGGRVGGGARRKGAWPQPPAVYFSPQPSTSTASPLPVAKIRIPASRHTRLRISSEQATMRLQADARRFSRVWQRVNPAAISGGAEWARQLYFSEYYSRVYLPVIVLNVILLIWMLVESFASSSASPSPVLVLLEVAATFILAFEVALKVLALKALFWESYSNGRWCRRGADEAVVFRQTSCSRRSRPLALAWQSSTLASWCCLSSRW